MSSLQPQSIQQLRADVEELKRALEELEVTGKRFTHVQREQIALLTASLALTRRLTGNENLDSAIAKMQRAITTAMMLRASLLALQAAAGPYGWALAIVGLAGTALTVGDIITELDSH